MSSTEIQQEMLKTGFELARRQQEERANRNNELLSLQQTEAKTVLAECLNLRKIISSIEEEKEKAQQETEAAHMKIHILEEEKGRLEIELGEAMKSESHLRVMLTDTQTIMSNAASNMNEISGNASALQKKCTAAEEMREKAENDLQALQIKHDAMEVRLEQLMKEVVSKDIEAKEAKMEAKKAEETLEEDTKRQLELQEKLHSLLQNPNSSEVNDLQMKLKIAEKAVQKFEKRIEHTVPLINALQKKWIHMEATSKANQERIVKKLGELQINRDPNISGISSEVDPETSKSYDLMDKANNLAASAALKLQETRNVASSLRDQLHEAKNDAKYTKTEVVRINVKEFWLCDLR